VKFAADPSVTVGTLDRSLDSHADTMPHARVAVAQLYTYYY
jgi:hypothetical protein